MPQPQFNITLETEYHTNNRAFCVSRPKKRGLQVLICSKKYISILYTNISILDNVRGGPL